MEMRRRDEGEGGEEEEKEEEKEKRRGEGEGEEEEKDEEKEKEKKEKRRRRRRREGGGGEVGESITFLHINPFLPDCKTSFSRIFYIFLCNFEFSRPEHDCYAKFTSCST